MERGDNWENIRRAVLKRDNYECRYCGESNKQLHVHHITPFDEFEDKAEANDFSNLITLCASCHRRWEQLTLRMAERPKHPEEIPDTTYINIALEDDKFDDIKETKEELGVTWEEFFRLSVEVLSDD